MTDSKEAWALEVAENLEEQEKDEIANCFRALAAGDGIEEAVEALGDLELLTLGRHLMEANLHAVEDSDAWNRRLARFNLPLAKAVEEELVRRGDADADGGRTWH